MINRVLRTSRPLGAFLLGLGGTLLVLAAFWTGLDPRTELRALDMRFGLTDASISDEILHVNIDDESLEAVGRWPWPRQKLAAIVDVLNDCGAKAVMVDLILNEPQEVRYEASAFQVYSSTSEDVLSQALPQPVYDNGLLGDSLSRAGNVFLTMHVNTTPDASTTSELYGKVSAFMSENNTVDLEPVSKSIPGPRKLIEKAYLNHRSLNSIRRFAIPEKSVEALDIRGGRMTPPLFSFADAAAGAGCVTYLPDTDKLVRRTPLFFKGDGQIYPQFAVALALSELAARHGGLESMNADDSRFTIRCNDGTDRVIPLDSNDFMVIRWPAGAIGTPSYGLEHIPARAAVKIWNTKNSNRLNANRIRGLRVQFINMGKELPDDPDIKKLYFDKYLKLSQNLDEPYLRRITAEQNYRKTLLFAPSKTPDSNLLDKLRKEETDIHQLLDDTLALLTAKLREPGNLEVFLGKPATDSPDDKQAFDKVIAQAASLHAQETKLQRTITKNAENIETMTDKLRQIVAGKICMLGATSSGVPDFVPTPLSQMTPGVIVHSNIINTILSGQFVYPAGMLANTLTILLAGVLVSLLASTRPILQAAPLSLLAAVGYAAFNTYIVFALWSVWLAFVAPLGAMLLSFLFVTAFRQLTEERAKRRIRAMWAQSLSPALVEQILKNPSMVNLGGENTELTCMFSDLAGFTPLSESLGPQKTVALLNRYFDGVTDIVQNRYEGYLNKFLGDGVFVLFGVPIKMADHPSRAVDAAMMCQAAVAKLNAALADELGGEAKLKVRIGLHSGEAIFGNCGSTEKTDYTAIGDCVNLSARLESANKFFGTKIIISQHAWSLCDRADLLVRPLGDVFITGVRNSLKILEVVGPVNEVDESRRKAVAHFAEAMELISNRKFSDARTRLQKADELRPEDQATRIYMDICEHCIEWGSEIDAWPAEAETSGGVVRLAWPERT